MALRYCVSAVFHWLCLLFLRPIIPLLGVPTMSKCFSLVPACFNGWVPDHFLPVLDFGLAYQLHPGLDQSCLRNIELFQCRGKWEFQNGCLPVESNASETGRNTKSFLRYLFTVRSSTSAAVVTNEMVLHAYIRVYLYG